MSSDETPAQKPSSLSVPPGALVNAAARPRGRRLLALAAVVLGGVFVFRQLTRDDAATTTAQHRVDGVVEPKRVESALAPQVGTQPERGASLPVPAQRASDVEAAPRAQTAPAVVPGTGTTADGKRASSGGAERSSAGGAPIGGAAIVSNGTPASPEARALPSVASSAAPPPSSPALNVEASAKESLGAVPPVRTVPTTPARPALATSPAVAAAPRPAAPPAPRSAPAPAVKSPAAEAPAVPRPPRPFDEALATQQFERATAQASRCSEAGSTRGTGRVKVSIEPWGRVGRVTHLTQDFVGTGVGLCVMQAFQQIQVPAFDGNSRSIAGEFVVE